LDIPHAQKYVHKAHKCTEKWARAGKLTDRIEIDAQKIVHKNIKRTKICAQSRLQVAYVRCERKEKIGRYF